MCSQQWKTIRIIFWAVSIIVMTTGSGICQTEEEIFNWTAGMLGVDSGAAMPQVYWVDQTVLQSVFVHNNRESYLRWETKLGPDGAREIMSQYLAEIVGLFEPRTDAVYVGTFLEPCRRQAVLAHEFTHYFQQRNRSVPVAWGENAEATQRVVREMEAYKIESLFEQTFCHTTDSPEESRP